MSKEPQVFRISTPPENDEVFRDSASLSHLHLSSVATCTAMPSLCECTNIDARSRAQEAHQVQVEAVVQAVTQVVSQAARLWSHWFLTSRASA